MPLVVKHLSILSEEESRIIKNHFRNWSDPLQPDPEQPLVSDSLNNDLIRIGANKDIRLRTRIFIVILLNFSASNEIVTMIWLHYDLILYKAPIKIHSIHSKKGKDRKFNDKTSITSIHRNCIGNNSLRVILSSITGRRRSKSSSKNST